MRLINAHPCKDNPTFDLVVAPKIIMDLALARSSGGLADGDVLVGLAQTSAIRPVGANLACVCVGNDTGGRGEHADTLNCAALRLALSCVHNLARCACGRDKRDH